MTIVTNIPLKWGSKLIGIYEIRCSANNKVYVGQSVNLYQRKIDHFKLLRNHKKDRKKPRHPCRHLQNAYNLYDENTFSFNVVYLMDEHLVTKIADREVIKIALQPLEQIFMNRHGKKKLFNSAPSSVSTAGIKNTPEHNKATSEARKGTYRCYHPEMGCIEFRGLKDFCKSIGASKTAFSAMLRGTSKTSHGFFRSKEDYEEWLRTQLEFELFHPKLGAINSKGRSQAQVEKDHDIPSGTISMLFAGVIKYTGGWFLSKKHYEDYVDQRGLSVYHPVEGTLKIFRVADFCAERNLNVNGINGLLFKNSSIHYNGYYKNKEVYEKKLANVSIWTSKYTGIERTGENRFRARIRIKNSIVYTENSNDELELALKYQAKRKELGLCEVPLLRIDKLVAKSNQEAA